MEATVCIFERLQDWSLIFYCQKSPNAIFGAEVC